MFFFFFQALSKEGLNGRKIAAHSTIRDKSGVCLLRYIVATYGMHNELLMQF